MAVLKWKLSIITRSFGLRKFALYMYIRYFVISVANKQYKKKGNRFTGTGEISLLYWSGIVISDLFISSFHCTSKLTSCGDNIEMHLNLLVIYWDLYHVASRFSLALILLFMYSQFKWSTCCIGMEDPAVEACVKSMGILIFLVIYI